jgi:Tol biopolymer transport system component
MRRGVLWAVPFDAEGLEVRGAEVPLLDGVAQALAAGHGGNITGAGQFAIGSSGALAWVPGPVAPHRDGVLVTVDRRGQVSPLPAPLRYYASNLRLSPDGRRLAVIVLTATERGLWLYDLARGTLEPLSRGGEGYWPIWSPDGRQVVFGWRENGQDSLRSQLADGSAPPDVVAMTSFSPGSWLPDGDLLGVVTNSTPVNGVATGYDLMVATLSAKPVRVLPVLQTPDNEHAPEASPDGRWLAYRSNRSGRAEVYVQPYPGPGARTAISVGGGMSPAWHPQGHELFYPAELLDADGKRRMMVVDFQAGSPSAPRPLFSVDPELWLPCVPMRCYDVAPDGERFYGVQGKESPPPPVVTHINLVQNWFEELKAKVPRR